MTKREAVIILIEHSQLLDDSRRARLKLLVPNMTETDIETLGKILTKIKEDSIRRIEEYIQKIDIILKNIV